MVKNILNFNIRSYKDRFFVSPTEYELSSEILSEYMYSIDMSSLDAFTAYLYKESIDFESLSDDDKNRTYSEFVLFELFDNKRFWGFYYPNYEIIMSDGKIILSPYSFYDLEYKKLLRRHKIEAYISENVRVET